MNKPHKHAALIKAWADGAVIEHYRPSFGWEECSYNTPCWSPETNYRIKPKTIRYRLALVPGSAPYVLAINAGADLNYYTHVKWLGHWQEVEI